MQITSLKNGLQDVIVRAQQIIGAGGVIVYPTDTVYGIGCDATCKPAVEKIIAMKHRENNTQFIVLADSFPMLERLAGAISGSVGQFIRELIPAPVTFVLKSTPFAAANIRGCEKTIAVRIPDNEFCLQLCMVSGVPLLSTSANLHGEPVGNAVENISPEICEQADLVIDGGALHNMPSTVVDLSDTNFRVIREGAYPREELIRKVRTYMIPVE